jgi:hypothetical protein
MGQAPNPNSKRFKLYYKEKNPFLSCEQERRFPKPRYNEADLNGHILLVRNNGEVLQRLCEWWEKTKNNLFINTFNKFRLMQSSR